MYRVVYTTQFKRKLKLCQKRGLNMLKLFEAIDILANKGVLPENYKPHILKGKFEGIWECHIEPDWLLLWQQYKDTLILVLVDTGSHSDIF